MTTSRWIASMALGAAACGSDGTAARPDAAVGPPAVSIVPSGPRVMVRNRVTLTARVGGAPGARVTWSATAGSIADDGVYTAPDVAGDVTVTATSVDAPPASASVTVTVVPPGTPPRFTASTARFDGAGLAYDGHTLVVLDADGDDRDDVLVFGSNFADNAVQDGAVRLWLRRDAGFTEATRERLGDEQVRADSARDHLVADLNGDGRDDVFAGQHGFDAPPFPGAHNLLFLSQPDGRLLEQAATRLDPYDHAFTHGVAAGDVDGDGDLDLFEANLNPSLSGPPHLQLNDGTGRFREDASRLPALLRTDEGSFTSSAFCDVDGDGDVDLVLGGWPNGPGDRVLLNDGAGRFSEATAGTLPAAPYGEDGSVTVKVVCVDVDRDGALDLLLSVNEDYERSTMVLWKNDGAGRFTDVSARLGAVANRHFHHEIDAADVNGDGLVDFVVSGWAPMDCPSMLLLQGPDGAFARREPPLPCGYLRVLDFDRDGRVDLVGYLYGWKELPTIFVNAGW
jgi:hypothetical protein